MTKLYANDEITRFDGTVFLNNQYSSQYPNKWEKNQTLIGGIEIDHVSVMEYSTGR